MTHLPSYQIRQCQNEKCRFRFPVASDRQPEQRCPRCGTATQVVYLEYSSPEAAATARTAAAPALEALLDNIRSIHNVGSMFRTADGAGVGRLYLCGITPTPAHPKLAKTALGAEQRVAWIHYNNGVDAAAALKKEGRRLWAIEAGSRAELLFTAAAPPAGQPIVLIVGNERAGVDPGILEQCDRILSLPMQGLKRSLNVAVAFGIAAYFLRYGVQNGESK